MNLKEKTVSKNYVYKGKILNLRCDDALLPDGKACKREIVEHSGGAAVLCVKDGNVALVKQFRYAYQEELYEIPAGKLNAGENPLEAARRELEEETGLVASKLQHLLTIYPSPGYTEEKIYIYVAEEVSDGVQKPDEDEFLSVEFLPLDKVREMILGGKINDAKTVAAVLSYSLQVVKREA